MPTLKDILIDVPVKELKGDESVEVKGLCIDSRKAAAGTVFIAIRGTASDGHGFIEGAIELGARVIVCEQMPVETVEGVVYVLVKNSHQVAGLLASAYYGHPSSRMRVVGITGTNGKTTTATLLYQLFQQLGYKSGLISTVQNQIGDTVEHATHTTPDAISVQALLARMADEGCGYAFMEVSSHAVHQERIAGIDFAGGVFTNITHDHLDYHNTFDEYIKVKKLFFDGLSSTSFALTNIDDKRGPVMLQNTMALKNTYGIKAPASFKGKVLENNLTGLVMTVDNVETHFRMIGTFNAYNLLAVYGTALLLGEEKLNVLSALSTLQGAQGRFETVLSPNRELLGIVDYAHTPDALINVLATINQLRVKGQNLVTVIGCGGDRDRTKRPVMAEAAAEHSDRVILTSDNPRTEDPEEILNEMMAGLSGLQKAKVLRITDRKEAIKTACVLAADDDIILVAGKGHETYQEIKGVKYPFDDREVLELAFQLLNK